MLQLRKEHVLQLFEAVFYFSLLGLGLYFIYEGEVIQRYLVGRTDFYQYNERITEFPTVVTIVNSAPNNLTLGEDFNVSLSLDDMVEDSTVLTLGKNHIQGTDLEVDFQHLYPGKELFDYKMTPVNLPREEAWWREFTATDRTFAIVYSFANASLWSQSKVAIKLSTENNTLWCPRHNDGDVDEVFASVGEKYFLYVQPEKFLYLSERSRSRCREKPYIDNLIEVLQAELSKHPGKQCRYPNMFQNCLALALREKINDLPICVNQTDIRYMTDLFSSVPGKPCTKVSYKIRAIRPFQTSTNHILFHVWLGSPYDIIVNAEYYLYDWISMIGAIGGTLGLCIGFSFMDFVRNLITFFIQGLKRIILFVKKDQAADQSEGPFQKKNTLKIRDTDQEGIRENIREMIRNEMSVLRKKLEEKIDYQNGKIDQCNAKLDQLKIRNEKEQFNKIETDEEKLRNSIF